MYDPYSEIARAIIKQAVSDYAKKINGEHPYREDVLRWVRNMSGTFDLCASAYGKELEDLQAMLFYKFGRIDQGEEVNLEKQTKFYKDSEKYLKKMNPDGHQAQGLCQSSFKEA